MIKKYIKIIIFNKLFKKIWNAISIRLAYRVKNELLHHIQNIEVERIKNELLAIQNIEETKTKIENLEKKIDLAIQNINNIFVVQNYQDLVQTKELFISILSKLIEKEDLWLHSYKELLFSSLVKEYTLLGKSPYELHSDLIYISNPSKLELNKKNINQIDPTKPLKILYICGMFPSVEHAGGLRLFDILKELTKKHEIDLYSCFNPELDSDTFELVKEFPFKSIRIEYGYEIEYQTLLTWINSKKIEYDIVQVEYSNAYQSYKYIKNYKKIGYTFMESISRNEYSEIIKNIKLYNYEYLKIRKFIESLKIEKDIKEKYNFGIALTNEDKLFINNISKDLNNINVVQTAVSNYAIFDRINVINEIDQNLVSFIGFFGHPPNLDSMEWYLKNIHPILTNQVIHYKLQIIGRGDISKLKILADYYSNIYFTGRVDNIVPYIEKSYICISPLINGAGFRGKINQYSALKKPTVSTTIGVSGTPYEDKKSVLISNNSELFAEHIYSLFKDKNLYEKISENAYAIVKEHYSWDKQIVKLEDIYYK